MPRFHVHFHVGHDKKAHRGQVMREMQAGSVAALAKMPATLRIAVSLPVATLVRCGG